MRLPTAGWCRLSSSHGKKAVKGDMKKGVVYEVPCGEYDHVYIGDTGRSLKERIKEHQCAMKKIRNSGIVAHAFQQQHKVKCMKQHY